MTFLEAYKYQVGAVALVAALMFVLWLISRLMEKKRSDWFKVFAEENGFSLKEDMLAPKVLFKGMVFYSQLKGIQFSNVLIKKVDDLQVMICESVYNTSHSRAIRHTKTNFIVVNEGFEFPDFAVQYVGKMDKINIGFYEKRGFKFVDYLSDKYMVNCADHFWAKSNLPTIVNDPNKPIYIEGNDQRLLVFEDTKRLETASVSGYLDLVLEVSKKLKS